MSRDKDTVIDEMMREFNGYVIVGGVWFSRNHGKYTVEELKIIRINLEKILADGYFLFQFSHNVRISSP